jgi:hypothetical protein
MNTAEEFISKIRELHEFYSLFSEFNDDDIPAERRDIILENLTLQMIKVEKEYTHKCSRE